MSSRGRATLRGQLPAARTTEHPPDVVMMRSRLREVFNQGDVNGRRCGACSWGVYAFYDFDGEPIYVGQTREGLSTRINRHLTNQRSDSVAMRILDPMEVAEVEIWPLWDLVGRSGRDSQAIAFLDSYEYAAYAAAIRGSRFGAILNEKIPPTHEDVEVELPTSYRGTLYTDDELNERRNMDVRIARRAESVSRVADVARERGGVSVGLRRVIVIQAVRLAYMAAERLALEEGRPLPSADVIDSQALFGSLLDDPEDKEYSATNESTFRHGPVHRPADLLHPHVEHVHDKLNEN